MHGLKSSFPSTCRLCAFDVVVIWAFHFKSERHAMRSLFVLTFALLMIACGDGGRRSEDQFSNPLYPSGPEQVQPGRIVTGEGSGVSGAEVVIIDAERLVVNWPVRRWMTKGVSWFLSRSGRATGWAFLVPIWQPTLTRRLLLRERRYPLMRPPRSHPCGQDSTSGGHIGRCQQR